MKCEMQNMTQPQGIHIMWKDVCVCGCVWVCVWVCAGVWVGVCVCVFIICSVYSIYLSALNIDDMLSELSKLKGGGKFIVDRFVHPYVDCANLNVIPP